MRNPILGMAAHDLCNAKTPEFSEQLPSNSQNCWEPTWKLSFAHAFSERYFKNWGGPRAPEKYFLGIFGAVSEGNEGARGTLPRDLRSTSRGPSLQCALQVGASTFFLTYFGGNPGGSGGRRRVPLAQCLCKPEGHFTEGMT